MGDGLWFIAVGGVCHARVEIVEFDAEGFAAFEVVEEGFVGLCGACWVRVGEVDEVGAVGDDVLVLGVGVVGAVCVEGRCLVGCEGRVGPFALGFEEEREGVGA